MQVERLSVLCRSEICQKYDGDKLVIILGAECLLSEEIIYLEDCSRLIYRDGRACRAYVKTKWGAFTGKIGRKYDCMELTSLP